MIQMGTRPPPATNYAPQTTIHRSDQSSSNQTQATIHLSTTCAQPMQSQAQPEPQLYDERHAFGQMAPPPPPPAVQQAAVLPGHGPPAPPLENLQYQYHDTSVQASQFVSSEQPLAQAYAGQYAPVLQAQQQQTTQYSSEAEYLMQPAHQQQQHQQQWPGTSPPFVYEHAAGAVTQLANQQYGTEMGAQVAPAAPDCGSPMSTQSVSPAAAGSSLLQASMTPPMNSIGGGGAAASQSGASATSTAGGSSSSQSAASNCGRLASPSGASSTISSSESVGNMSINLEQYISKRNERERSRVRNVNDAFDNLKNSLPLEMEKLSKRMSKVEILRTAISYIKNLEEVLGYKQQQQQNARDDRAILQQQQQQQHCAANGQTASMIRKRPRSGSVGHLLRSSVGKQQRALLQERALDCENSMRLAWRHDARPASSLSRHELLMLDDDFAYSSSFQPHQHQQVVALMHEQMATSCRQDTFRQEQALVKNYRRRQQQQHDQHVQLSLHQTDHEMSLEPGAAHGAGPASGFEEFNPNVRCYNERNFDNY